MTHRAQPRSPRTLHRTSRRARPSRSARPGEATRLASFAAGLLLVLVPFFTACLGGELVAEGEATGQSGGAAGPGSDDGWGGDRSSPASAIVVEELVGDWVVERRSPGGRALWGHGVASVTSRVDGTLTLSAEMDDGSTHLLAVEGVEEGRLVGYYAESLEELLERPAGFQNWSGSLEREGARIRGERLTAAGTERTSFHRAVPVGQSATGLWMSDDTSMTAVAGCDGDSLLLTVVEGCRSWDDVTRHFDLTISEGSPLLEGWSAAGPLEAMAFGQEGELRLHLRETASNGTVRTALFLQGDEPPPLTGRWILRETQYPGELPRRGSAIAVEYADELYLYESFDHGGGLLRGRCASIDGDQVVDGRRGWAGRLDESRERIAGSYGGPDGWRSSLERAVEPWSGELSGQWQSITVDWRHHDAAGGNVTFFGEATIVHDGESLEITDVYDSGEVYHVEAAWSGDHYEGIWYPAAAPESAWPWRGELSPSGTYLHGTWDQGEYSFAVFPVISEDDFEERDGPALMLSVDPFADVVLRGRDAEGETSVSIERDLERETAVNVVTGAGAVRMELDERLRATRLVQPGSEVSLEWSEDGATVAVSILDTLTGEVTRREHAFEVDVAAVVAQSYVVEGRWGADMSLVRTWLLGRDVDLAAIFAGEVAPPSLVALLNDPTVLRSLAGRGVSKDGYEDPHVVNELGFFVAIVGAWALTFQVFGWVPVGAGLLTAATFLLFGLVSMATIILTAHFLGSRLLCHPCTLACYWSCGEPVEGADD